LSAPDKKKTNTDLFQEGMTLPIIDARTQRLDGLVNCTRAAILLQAQETQLDFFKDGRESQE
jgi:hypothetical protein